METLVMVLNQQPGILKIGFLDATCGGFNRLVGLTSPGHALPLNGNNNMPHLMRGPF